MIDFELGEMVGHLVRTCQQAHSALWSTEFAGLMTSPQFAVLHVLAHEEPLGQTTLRTRVSLDRTTTGAVIQRLIDRQWITRVRDPDDGRRYLVRLTELGRTVHSDAVGRADRVNEQLLQAVSHDERHELVRLLNTLSAHHRGLLDHQDELPA